MIKEEKDNEIPSNLIPRCPICGEEMEANLRKDETFVEDEGWNQAKDRYVKFIEDNKDKKILFLELGIGFNTQGIINIPFIQMTYRFLNANYVVINNDDVFVPKEIEEKTLLIKDDLKEIIYKLINK